MDLLNQGAANRACLVNNLTSNNNISNRDMDESEVDTNCSRRSTCYNNCRCNVLKISEAKNSESSELDPTSEPDPMRLQTIIELQATILTFGSLQVSKKSIQLLLVIMYSLW